MKVLDYANMMTYDFNGTWSSDVNHKGPLYPPAGGFMKESKSRSENQIIPRRKKI